MLELFEINPKDQASLKKFKDIANPLIREYFTSSVPDKVLYTMLDFLDENIISKEIQKQLYCYYFILLKSKIIGYIEMHKIENILRLGGLFLLQEYRKKGYGGKIIEIIKSKAKKENIEKIKTSTIYNKKSAENFFTKNGFFIEDEIARYIGGNFYLYENVLIYIL